jgi:hypothetical protein
VLAGGCSSSPNQLVSQTVSPDKKLKAVVYIMPASSINTDVINVSILNTNAPLPTKAGNVFSSYVPQDVQVTWTNASSLVIQIDGWKYGTNGRRKVRGVTITYVPEEPSFTTKENLDAAKETAKQLIKDIKSR